MTFSVDQSYLVLHPENTKNKNKYFENILYPKNKNGLIWSYLQFLLKNNSDQIFDYESTSNLLISNNKNVFSSFQLNVVLRKIYNRFFKNDQKVSRNLMVLFVWFNFMKEVVCFKKNNFKIENVKTEIII